MIPLLFWSGLLLMALGAILVNWTGVYLLLRHLHRRQHQRLHQRGQCPVREVR